MSGERRAARRRTRVKICGITRADDAEAAIALGADALGFNFWPGSRRFLPVASADWISDLPAGVLRVAILVNPSAVEARTIAALPFIDALQLHGAETPEFCGELHARGIAFAKAVPVSAPDSLRRLPNFSTRTLVLDSAQRGEFGGSGRSFAWEIASDFAATHPRHRVVLAGGLTPENVGAAVLAVRPFAVDVTTGVESQPGRKDHGRLRDFIANARAAARA